MILAVLPCAAWRVGLGGSVAGADTAADSSGGCPVSRERGAPGHSHSRGCSSDTGLLSNLPVVVLTVAACTRNECICLDEGIHFTLPSFHEPHRFIHQEVLDSQSSVGKRFQVFFFLLMTLKLVATQQNQRH